MLNDLCGARFLRPSFRKNLFTVPFSLLQEQLRKLGDVFCLQSQSPSPGINSTKIGLPINAGNPERLEQSRLQVIEYFLSRCFLYDSREHVRGHAIVKEARTWFVFYRQRQKGFYPVFCLHCIESRIRFLSHRHRQKIFDVELLEVSADSV